MGGWDTVQFLPSEGVARAGDTGVLIINPNKIERVPLEKHR